ncbi:hypothetical protein ACQ4PT_039628 [Festuca glaucescens]
MPPANAAPPRAGPSPRDTAVAPHGLGFPPPPAGSPPPSNPSGKPRHGSELVPDTEDDPRTPGSAEFFLREPPESPDGNTTLAHATFTYEQHLQLRAQLCVCSDLCIGKPSAEHTMVHAFGEPAEGQKHVWQELWRAAVDRWETQQPPVPGYDTPPSSSLLIFLFLFLYNTGKPSAEHTMVHAFGEPVEHQKQPPVSGYDTPPSSSLIGSCTGEQGSKDTTVGKRTVSEQGDAGEKETQVLDVGNASILPPKITTNHTEMLEQKNGHEDHLAISFAEQVYQSPSDDGSNLKNNAVCAEQTFLESYCSLPKNNPRKNITKIQESCHSGSKSVPNSPRDLQESSSSRIGSCIAEQSTVVDKTSILEQHSSDGCQQVSQGTDSGSDRNHLADSTIDKDDHVISDDVNNLEQNTLCGGKQSLLDSCYQCGKHGHLLKCRSCPIAAHVSCFGPFVSSVRFNDGQFYCPVCFCFKATEAHKKAEKTLSEAKKHLHAFLLKKQFAKQHCEQSTKNQQLPCEGEEPGHEKRSDASVACPGRNYDPRTPARTRSPLAPRRKSFVTTARRTRLLWTGEEEAALREAVALFAPKGKGQISWVQIREHGKDVFHPTRLPKDPSQKWNYMKRKSEANFGRLRELSRFRV